MTNHETEHVVKLIQEGTFDATLQVIHTAINKRQATLRQIQAASTTSSLHPGDTVTLTRIRPQYMEGASATVLEKSGSSGLLVQLNESNRRFAAGSVVTVDASCVKRVVPKSGEPSRDWQ